MTINVADIERIIAGSKDSATQWDAILSRILTAFDCTTGTIHTLDRGSNVLLLKAHRGIPEFLLTKVSTIPVGKGMAGIAAQRMEPVQVCNLQTDESGVAKPSARETKVEGSITVPLILGGILFGTLGIAKPVSYEFSPDETAALMTIGASISKIIQAG